MSASDRVRHVTVAKGAPVVLHVANKVRSGRQGAPRPPRSPHAPGCFGALKLLVAQSASGGRRQDRRGKENRPRGSVQSQLVRDQLQQADALAHSLQR